MESVNGFLTINSVNNSVLPVGHTIIKGVDIADGHLVHSVTDLKIPGRGLSLEFTRTYSSTSTVKNSPLGPGWADNYHSRLIANTECNYFLIIGGEGQGQRFSITDLKPAKGYHGKLMPSTGGNGYDFITKEGVIYHYSNPIQTGTDDDQPVIAANLEYIRDPNGNQITFTYNPGFSNGIGLGRLESVTDSSGRVLTFQYQQFGSAQRIVQIDGPMGLQVKYSYDALSNLLTATRVGGEGGGGGGGEEENNRVRGINTLASSQATADRVWSYVYTGLAGDSRTQHRIETVTDPNGNITSYQYYTDNDLFNGEGAQPPGCTIPNCTFFAVANKVNNVKQITEPLSNGQPTITKFTYDYSQTTVNGTHVANVIDARNLMTQYTLNSNGSPIQIDQPLGVRTKITWNANDIYKDQEIDANGRVTKYQHDANGNLIEERIFAVDPDTQQTTEIVTSYTYDATFNRLTSRTEPHAANTTPRTTTYEINPANGNLMSVKDALGHVTRYSYDSNGSLIEKVDSRAIRTTYSYAGIGGQYGNPTTITQEVGNGTQIVTNNEYDDRSRLIKSVNSFGKRIDYLYDELDRVVSTVSQDVNPATNFSSPYTTVEFSYYPNGELKTERLDDISKKYLLDGLNRPIVIECKSDEFGANPVTYTTSIKYDGNSNKIAVTDRRGVTFTTEYDGLNRAKTVRVAGPYGGPNNGTDIIAQYSYDPVGNKLSEIDLKGNTTSFVYDGLYRVKRRILPESNPATGQAYREEFVYDEIGNLLSSKNVNGHTTTYQYDLLSRLTNVTDAAGRVSTFEYAANDASANAVLRRDVTRGLMIAYEYDGLYRKTKQTVTLPNLQDNGGVLNYVTSYVYNDVEHTVIATDPRNQQHLIQINAFDLIAKRIVDFAGNHLNITTRFSYDARGNLAAEVDPRASSQFDLAYITRYDYRKSITNQVEEIRHRAGGGVEKLRYDGEGLLISSTDQRGIVREFSYDNLGRPLTTILQQSISASLDKQLDPAPEQLTLSSVEYDDTANTVTITDASGRKRKQELDRLGRVKRIIDGVGLGSLQRQREFTYDGINQLSATDWHTSQTTGNITTFSYDAVNRLTQLTDVANRTEQTQYFDAENRIVSIDRGGIKQTSQFDALGRLVSSTVIGSDGTTITTVRNKYDGNSNLIELTDALNNVTGYEYDNANRRIRTNRGVGSNIANTISYGYDPAGNLLNSFNGTRGIQYEYDPMNRVQLQYDGIDFIQYQYNLRGELIESTDRYRHIRYAYDELGALLQVIRDVNASLVTEEYRYDALRRRRADYRSDYTVVRKYDGLGRLSSLEEHNVGAPGTPLTTTSYQYDANDNLVQLTDAKGQVVQYSYDNLQRLSSASYPGAVDGGFGPVTQQYSYVYNNNDLLTTVTETRLNAAARQYQLSYDGLDRLVSQTDGLGKTIQFTYFDNGLRKRLTDSLGNTINYGYDAINRLTSVSSLYGSANYEYYSDDLLKACIYPGQNGVQLRADYDYDNAGRITSVINKNLTANQVISQYGLEYLDDQLKIRINSTQQVDSQVISESNTFTFGNDSRLSSENRLVRADYSEIVNGVASNYTVEYDYTAAGYRERERISTSTTTRERNYNYGVLGRLNQVVDSNGTTTSFSYDTNGNLTRKEIAVAGTTTQAIDYQYDISDRLRLVKDATANATLGAYEYSYEGQRIRQQTQNGVIHSSYDGNQLLTEWDNNLQPMVNYVWGAQLAARSEVNGNNRTNYHYLFDHLGSTTNVVSTTGQLAASFRYDAFGVLREPNAINNNGNRLTFTGQQLDTETGLYSVGQGTRYLDPTLGQFTQRDSLFGNIVEPRSLNRYAYGFNNPLRFTDPTGLEVVGENGEQILRNNGESISRVEGYDVINGRIVPRGAEQYKARIRGASGALTDLGQFLSRTKGPFVILEEGDKLADVFSKLSKRGILIHPDNIYSGPIEKVDDLVLQTLTRASDVITNEEVGGGSSVRSARPQEIDTQPGSSDYFGSEGTGLEGAEAFVDGIVEGGIINPVRGIIDSITSLRNPEVLRRTALNFGTGGLASIPDQFRTAQGVFTDYSEYITNPAPINGAIFDAVNQAGPGGIFNAIGKGVGTVGFGILTSGRASTPIPELFTPVPIRPSTSTARAGGLADDIGKTGRLFDDFVKTKAANEYSTSEVLDLQFKHESLIRILSRGEDKVIRRGTYPAQELANLMGEITIATGREVGLLRVGGQRVLRLGDSVSVFTGDAERVIAHTHPSGKLKLSDNFINGERFGDIPTFQNYHPKQRSTIIIGPTGQGGRFFIPRP
ncbi:MAG: RHS repeat-associated core domain-containing protein [Acidobacteriota bacterium]